MLGPHEGNQRVDRLIKLRAVLGRTRDDERRTRLINEDRVDFVHDGIVLAALVHLRQLGFHVVAQIVKAKLVVGRIGDIGLVGSLLLGFRLLRHDNARGQAQR